MDIEEHAFHTGAVAINYSEGLPSGPTLVWPHGGVGRVPGWYCFQ
jgi:hypothetical protein